MSVVVLKYSAEHAVGNICIVGENTLARRIFVYHVVFPNPRAHLHNTERCTELEFRSPRDLGAEHQRWVKSPFPLDGENG